MLLYISTPLHLRGSYFKPLHSFIASHEAFTTTSKKTSAFHKQNANQFVFSVQNFFIWALSSFKNNFLQKMRCLGSTGEKLSSGLLHFQRLKCSPVCVVVKMSSLAKIEAKIPENISLKNFHCLHINHSTISRYVTL